MIGLRRALWLAGGPVRVVLLAGIGIYRATLSGWLGGQCRFYPTCSAYAEEAIRIRGAMKGSVLAGWRILRCNPFGGGGIEHVPGAPERSGSVYENIIPTHTREAVREYRQART